VLLQIRNNIREIQRSKERGKGGIRGSRVIGTLGLMASQKSSPARSRRAQIQWPDGALGTLREGKLRGDHRVFKGGVRVADLSMNCWNLRMGRRSRGRCLARIFRLEFEGDTDR
jgi:hypothetical protein